MSAISTSSYDLYRPLVSEIPLVCDSPHSGAEYPTDFGHAVPRELLRSAEDTDVDALWAGLPGVGATLIAARFPRSYIDPNRRPDDIDPALLASPWPGLLDPGEKSRIGSGLIWTTVDKDTPIYERRLTVAEVRHRIDGFYRPYHQALAAAIGQSHARFGAVWHLNLHSMPDNAYERLGLDSSRRLADFVLGDRDGTTCEPAFVDLIESDLRGKGYVVARNDPYKGVELIGQIGHPLLRRNSLQIEIRRPLYMDERTRERNEGFGRLQADLNSLARKIAGYVAGHLPAAARAP
jgi:N-formylglutamate deformylase